MHYGMFLSILFKFPILIFLVILAILGLETDFSLGLNLRGSLGSIRLLV